LAAIYNVALFSPVNDISEREKEKLSPIKDRHLRDAHAAAVLCWRKYANKIRHIFTVEKSQEKASFLIHALLNGMCISEAEREYEARKNEREEVKMVVKKESKKEQVKPKTSELLEEIIQLKRKNKQLEEENKTLRKMLERVKRKKREEMKNAEIKKLKNRIYALLSEVKRLRTLIKK